MSNYPKAGQFYYHFKHNPEKGVLDYCYKIIGVGFHTETGQLMLAYQALYTKEMPNENVNFYLRPLEMFTENVEKPELNYFGPRFRLVEDEVVIRKLNVTSLII